MRTVTDALRELRRVPHRPRGTLGPARHGRSTMANRQPHPCPAGAAATQAIMVTHGIQWTERGYGGRLGEEVAQ